MVAAMFIEDLWNNPANYWATIITIVISITLHELAHGIVAIWHGDRTPIETGRMTASPIVHMGPFSLLVMFISGIAWGQMPIDPTRMRGKFAEARVALAGPLTNFLLGFAALTALALWQRSDGRSMEELSSPMQNLRLLLITFGVVNIHLALFNLIPIPPLDGSHIVSNFSDGYARATHSFMMQGGAILGLMLVFTISAHFIAPLAVKISVNYVQAVRGDDRTVDRGPRIIPMERRRFEDDEVRRRVPESSRPEHALQFIQRIDRTNDRPVRGSQ